MTYLTCLILHPWQRLCPFIAYIVFPFLSILCVLFCGCHWDTSVFCDQVNPSLFSSSSISFYIKIFHLLQQTFIIYTTYVPKLGQTSVFNTFLLFCTFSYLIDGDIVLKSDVQYCSKKIVFKYAQLFGIKLCEGPRFRTMYSNWQYQCLLETQL